MRRTLFGALAALTTLGVVMLVSAVATAAPSSITFVAPSPAEGSTLTTNATSFAFTYPKKPNATRTLTCTLAGPTASTGPCNAPVADGSKGAKSGKSYSGLRNGSYTLTVSLTLTDGGKATGTRHFTVAVAPVAAPDSYTLNEDGLRTANVLGNDSGNSGNSLTAVLVTGPAHGSLILNANGSFTYTPQANFNGSDSFTYRANDGSLNSNVATVSITVNPVNDAPTAGNDSTTTNEDTPLTIATASLLANDVDIDGDTLTATSVQAGPNTHGTVALIAGTITYTPEAGFAGEASFTYTVSDGHGGTGTGTVSVTVAPAPNAPPVANGQSLSTYESVAKAIVLTGSDPDGDPLDYSVSSAPLHGTLTGTAPNLTYTPDPGYLGPDSLGFTVSDGQATSALATVSITVIADPFPASRVLCESAPHPGGFFLAPSTSSFWACDILFDANDVDGMNAKYEAVFDACESDGGIPAPDPLGTVRLRCDKGS